MLNLDNRNLDLISIVSYLCIAMCIALGIIMFESNVCACNVPVFLDYIIKTK